MNDPRRPSPLLPKTWRILVFSVLIATAALLEARPISSAEKGQADYDALLKQGDALVQADRYDEAIAAFTKAIELNSRNGAAFRKRGYVKWLKSDNESAIADYSKAIFLDPMDYAAYYGRSRCQFDLKRYAESLEDCETVISLNPQDSEAFYFRSLIKQETKDYNGAIQDINKALELDPSNDIYFNVRASVKKDMADDKGALADYSRSLEIKPNEWAVLYARAKLLLKTGDPRAALKDITKALEIKDYGFMRDLLKQIQAAVTGTFVPASGGQSVEDQLKRLESSDTQVRDAAVIALAKLGPGGLDTIFVNAALILGPRFQRIAEEGIKGDPVLERILADLGRALAAMGPAAAEELAKRGTSGELNLESDLSLRALNAMGPQARKAIPILKAALASENTTAQWGGMLGLAAVDGPDYPTLRAALRSPNPDIRALAVAGFGKTGSPAAVDIVLAASRDQDMVVEDAAVTAMRDLGPLLVPKIPELLAIEGFEFRVPFDMMGATAVPPLKNLLLRGQSPLCDRAGVALARAGGPALPALSDALGHPNPAVRLAAVSALLAVDGNKKFVAESLAKVWKDGDPAVRDAGLNSLPLSGDEGGRLVPIFMAGLKDSSAPERIRSAMALAKLGQRAQASAGALMAALSDSEGGVRSAAAQALGLVGPDSGLAVPKLVLLAKDPDAVVRQGAVFALGNMKAGPEIQKVLLQAVEDPDSRVASEAVMSFWGYESASTAAKPILLRSLKSGLKEIKLAALDVLSKWKKAFPEEAKPILETLRAQDPDQEIKDAADQILRRFAPASDNPSLAPPPPPPLPPAPPTPPMFRRSGAVR